MTTSAARGAVRDLSQLRTASGTTADEKRK